MTNRSLDFIPRLVIRLLYEKDTFSETDVRLISRMDRKKLNAIKERFNLTSEDKKELFEKINTVLKINYNRLDEESQLALILRMIKIYGMKNNRI